MKNKSASELTLLFAKQLKEARQKSGLSQRCLGIVVDLDMFVASSRINRYEQSVHQPDIGTAYQLAEVLNLPAGYFYTSDDFIAQALLHLHDIKPEQQAHLLELLRSLSEVCD